MLIGVAVGIGFYLGGALSDGPKDREIKVPVIRTSDEANQYLSKAEKLSVAPLEKLAQGLPITDPERNDLREAANYLHGVIGFERTNFPPYLAEARIRLALGDYEDAFSLVQQCIQLAPPPSPPPSVTVVQIIAEAHYVSSQCLFFNGRFEEAREAAKLAVALAPNSPDYLIAGASAELELKHEGRAKGLVQEALALDPKHKRALGLAKLLKLPTPN